EYEPAALDIYVEGDQVVTQVGSYPAFGVVFPPLGDLLWVRGSVVCSLASCFLEICGTFVFGRKGKTFQPDSARSSAACKVWLVVGCFSVLIGGSPNWTARPPTPLGPGVLL